MEKRVLPQDLNAEAGVISAMIVDSTVIPKAAELITEKSFYRNAHRLMFRCIVAMFNRGDNVDIITLGDALRKLSDKKTHKTHLEMVGGQNFINMMSDVALSGANIESHINIVLEKEMLRSIINTGAQMIEDAYRSEKPAVEILEESETKIFGISTAYKTSYKHIKDIIPSAMGAINDAAIQKVKNVGLPYGFIDLDRILGGLKKGKLIILAARPSVGKTSLALNIANNVASRNGAKVLFVTMEMEGEEIVTKMISSGSGISMSVLEQGFGMDEDRINRVFNVGKDLEQIDLYIDDASTQTNSSLRAKGMRMSMEDGIDLMVIDYLQLMSGSSGSAESRQNEISAISRNLKILAKDLGIPIIALSQLNRGVEGRDDKRPKLSDLRESGAIEQDADVVMFIYRDEVYYQVDKDNVPLDNEGKAEVIVAKNRNGAIGMAPLTFIKESTRFTDIGGY